MDLHVAQYLTANKVIQSNMPVKHKIFFYVRLLWKYKCTQGEMLFKQKEIIVIK